MILLIADDYALTDGVSDAILTLARAERLSGTSVMTNRPAWPARARELRDLRGRLSLGLHLTLTCGAPLGAMPQLCPDGQFPSLRHVVLGAWLGRLDATELANEINRQFDAFEAHVGSAPDHIDGHQHVHGLPLVRDAVLAIVAERYPRALPLVRDSTAPATGVPLPLGIRLKARQIGLVSQGFRGRLQSAELPTNDTFAGISAFDRRTDYVTELTSALGLKGSCGLVMCHPGHPDATLRALDPVVERRQDEFDALMAFDRLNQRIWHPDRARDGVPVTWPTPPMERPHA